MRKLRQLDAVLLAQQALIVSALSNVVDLNRLVARRRHEQLSFIVVVNRQDSRLRLSIFYVFATKQLKRRNSIPSCQLSGAPSGIGSFSWHKTNAPLSGESWRRRR